MIEVLCGRTPANLHSPDLNRTLAFYVQAWGFAVRQKIPGVLAIVQRESVTVQLWQCLADVAPQTSACRLLVDDIGVWQSGLLSAPGQAAFTFTEERWGTEAALSDCDGNRLQLVQSAPHRLRRKARA